MIRRYVFQILILIVLLNIFACTPRSKQSTKMPELQSSISYQPLKPQEWMLSNGLKVLFVKDDELPIIRGSLLLPKGALWEIPGKPALVGSMGFLMRQGGAGNLNADELDLELEKLAASVASGYSGEYGTLSFSCLSSDFNKVFSIFSDVVLKPRFENDRIDLWKGQSLEAIRRRTDDPSTIAGIAFKELIYGDNAFGRTLTSSDVNQITREDLITAQQQFIVPQGAVLAVVGDIDREQLEKAVNEKFSTWTAQAKNTLQEPNLQFTPTPGIYFVTQPLEQATVYIGQQGPARLPPDYVAIEAFNNIFGSGDFGARLIKSIRTELGLAYSLYGAVLPGFMKGQNVIVIQTKAGTIAQATTESLRILSDMQNQKVETSELSQAKQAIQNSLIFKVDTPDDALMRQVLLGLLKYPADYDATYLDKINSLQKEDIQAVATHYWNLQKLVVIVVGDEKAYNLIKADLEKNPQSYYNLPLKKCGFEEKLEQCV